MKKLTKILLSLWCVLLFASPHARAVYDPFKTLSYEGVLTNTSGIPQNLDGKTITFSIVDSNDCVVYQETSTAAGDSSGNVIHKIGTGSPVFPSASALFDSSYLTDAKTGSGPCSAGANTERLLKIEVWDLGFAATIPFSAVPYAMTAKSAQAVTGVVGIANGGTGATTQTGAANAILPAQSTSAGKYLTTDGTNVTWSSVGGISSLIAGTGLTGGNITTSGTIAVDVGTTAGKIVQLDSSAKLPVVDGSQLTNLNPTSLSAVVPLTKGGTGLTALGSANQVLGVNAAGTAAEYKTITAGSGVTVTHGANAITISSSGGTGTVTNVTGTAPISVSNSTIAPVISITTADTSNTGALTSADWNTFNSKLGTSTSFSGDVSGAYNATSVDKIKGTAVSITSLTSGNFLKYNGSNWVNTNLASGDVPNLDWSKITTGKPITLSGYGITDAMSSTLSSGEVWVGDGSNVATARMLKITDIKSSVNNVSNWMMATGACPAGQALTYSTVTDTLDCATYSITNSQVTTALGFTPANSTALSSYVAKSGDTMTGALVNNTNSASAAVAVTQSGAGPAATFMGGNVGIGTTAPQAKLDVKGSIVMSGATSGYTGFAPAPVAGSTVWTLPSADGSNGQVLTTNGSGALTWSSPFGAGVSSLNGSTQSSQTFATPGTSGTAPAWSTNTGTGVHTLNIPMASGAGVTAGLLSKTDYDDFASRLGTSTSFIGDVSGAYNSTSVDKIKGKSVSPVTYASGQVLRYDGTNSNWVNALLNISTDITGTLPVANGGTGATSLGSGNLLVGSGTGAVTSLAAGVPGNVVYATGATTWASGTPDAAGLVDKSTTQILTGAKAFSNYIQMNAQNEVRFADSDSSNYVGIKAPAAVGSNVTWTLPSADGSNGQMLSTDGSGTLSWSTPGAALSALTAAGATNTIDSTNYAQTWNWSTATTQSPMSIAANALTTGSLLNLTTSSASLNSTNGLLNVANTSASTSGMVARIQSNSTAGSGLTVLASGNIGVGTTSPSEKLDINGAMRLQPLSTTPSVSQGSIYVSDSTGANQLKWYDGFKWRNVEGTADPFQITGSSTTVLTSDDGKIYSFTNNATDGVVTLPSSSSVKNGFSVTIQRLVAKEVTVILGDPSDRFPGGKGPIKMQGRNLQSITLMKVALNSWIIKNQAEDCTTGEDCWNMGGLGQSQIYAGTYLGHQYFTTPGNCTSISGPCDGQSDSFSAAWASGTDSQVISFPSATDGKSQSYDISTDITPSHLAAKFCEDLAYAGYTDWYLPAREELVFLVRNAATLGGFNFNGTYWTSTEQNASNALSLNLGDNTLASVSKNSANYVRCVRRF